MTIQLLGMILRFFVNDEIVGTYTVVDGVCQVYFGSSLLFNLSIHEDNIIKVLYRPVGPMICAVMATYDTYERVGN